MVLISVLKLREHVEPAASDTSLFLYCGAGLRLAAAATALSATAFGAQAQALKLGHITPPTHVWHQVAEKIATDLDAASGGKMKIAVSPLQKLGNEAQMINLMQAGAQPFGIFTVGGLANREESFLGWSLPYVSRTWRTPRGPPPRRPRRKCSSG